MGAQAVFLVGFMGSGKTSVGRELARRMGWEFVDLDVRIEQREGRSVPEIFQDRGEPGFRIAEAAALLELTQSLERASVVALGGGAFAQPGNRELLGSWPDGPWSPDFHHGCRVQAICEATERSAETQHWVDLSEVHTS